jgi:hypothetical protein
MNRRYCYGKDCEEDNCRCHSEQIKKEVELEFKKKELADRLGMTYAGLNNDGEPEFIGTDRQWKEFNSLIEEI